MRIAKINRLIRFGLIRSVLVGGYFFVLSCNFLRQPSSSAPIIGRYNVAECVPPSKDHLTTPITREWHTRVELADGSSVLVRGTQAPGGRIQLETGAPSQTFVVANPGDYIYPSDVRIDKAHDLLYVKAAGLAGGLHGQMWLYEYDLRHKRSLDQRLVTKDALGSECPE